MVGAGGGLHHAVERFCDALGDLLHGLGPGGGWLCVRGGHDDDKAAAAAVQLRTDAEMMERQELVKESGLRTYVYLCVCYACLCVCCLIDCYCICVGHYACVCFV